MLPILNIVVFCTAIAVISGLECFTVYDEREKTCSWNYYSKFVDDAEECCKWSKARAYATIKPKSNETVPCNSCKLIRDENAVVCFQEVHHIGQRTCHKPHFELSTTKDCCVYRGASSNDYAQGFYQTLTLVNKTEQTYLCTPCNEVVVHADIWTGWSECNVTCGGGYKWRKKVCVVNKVSPSALCIGLTEYHVCNDHPCGGSDATLIIITVVSAVILFVVCCVCVCKSSRVTKRFSSSSRYPAFEAVVFRKDKTDRGGGDRLVQNFEAKTAPQTPRYQMGRRTLPLTPPTDSPEPLHEILIETSATPRLVSTGDDPDAHTYASIDTAYYDFENSGYIAMTTKRN